MGEGTAQFNVDFSGVPWFCGGFVYKFLSEQKHLPMCLVLLKGSFSCLSCLFGSGSLFKAPKDNFDCNRRFINNVKLN